MRCLNTPAKWLSINLMKLLVLYRESQDRLRPSSQNRLVALQSPTLPQRSRQNNTVLLHFNISISLLKLPKLPGNDPLHVCCGGTVLNILIISLY